MTTTPPPAQPAPAAPVAAGPKQTLSLISFIAGLVSVVFTWIPVFGLLAGIAAIILGVMGRRREPAAPKWMSLVGIIAGIVGIVLGIIFFITLIILPLIFAATLGTSVYGY